MEDGKGKVEIGVLRIVEEERLEERYYNLIGEEGYSCFDENFSVK